MRPVERQPADVISHATSSSARITVSMISGWSMRK